MFSKLLVVVAVAVAVNAQGTSSISPCVLACVEPAAADVGCSL